MASVVRMPSVMANATEAAIQAWLVEEGSTIEVGTPLAEIETEKAVVDYAAEEAGTVGRLLATTGESLEVGAPIAVLLAAGEGADAIAAALASAGVPDAGGAEPPTRNEPPAGSVEADAEGEQPDAGPAAAAPSSPASDPVVGPAPGSPHGRLFASPVVRRLAKQRGIVVDALTGSGPGGRIVRRDLDAAPAAAPSPAAPPAPAPVPRTAPPAPAAGAAFTDEPLSGMRRTIARRLTESKTTVPHFYVSADVRVDRLLALRRELNEASPRRISVNDLVVKAVASALVDVPAANAIWNGDSVRRFSGVDLAIAVAVADGLLTPVLRGVDGLGIAAVSARIAELAERARAGRLRQEELEGGAFSISNLGMYGVDAFSAILNPPQSGILAVSAAKQRPVVDDGALAVATVMTVTLSADHRVIDGAVAAEWLAAFVRRMESPLALLL